MSEPEGREPEKKSPRHIGRRILVAFMAVLSCLYLYDNGPWLWRVALARAMGIQLASSHSVFELVNETGEHLVVEVCNLNARDSRVRSLRKEAIHNRLGRGYSVEFHLPANSQHRVVLPALEYRSIGLAGVTARTEWSTLPLQPNQKVALMVIPMHLTSRIHPDYRIPEEGYPVFRIEPADLEPLSMRDAEAVGVTKVKLSRPQVP